MKPLKRLTAMILALSLLFMHGCAEKPQPVETFHGVLFPVSVYSDIIIKEGFLYSGEFPEDGSFEIKQNVLALKVENTSDKDLQLVRIYVTTSEKELLFEITTLPAKSIVTVFEKNAQTLSENETITDFRGENRIDFESPISLHSNIFSISAPKGVINIRNISRNDISGNIYVYYKKKSTDGSYFGGITFRTKADGLKAGEFNQLPASHYDKEDSEVLFVDYAGE